MLQFQRYEPDETKITETEFAAALISYSGFADVRRTKMLKRVKRKFRDEPQVPFIFHDNWY